MNVLCFSDKSPDSDHSAVEGIFNGSFKSMAEQVYIVYFSRKSKTVSMSENKIVLPWRFKYIDVVKPLGDRIDLTAIDVVIVRNFFQTLNKILKYRHKFQFIVGFWESFPHNFRRIYQARLEQKHLFRKTLEYHLKRIRERKSLQKCDFYLPITESYKNQFYGDLNIPFYPLPMGVDFSKIPIESLRPANRSESIRRFIYTGAVDGMRQLDVVVSAFLECKTKFEFHIYTSNNNSQVNQIQELRDPRIVVKKHLPRKELLQIMAHFDIGIGLIPETPLYRSSSPTKTLEYYALGLPAVISRLPEYSTLFDSKTAFFCEFKRESISACINRIGNIPQEEICQMGKRGRQKIMKERNYSTLSAGLFDFLRRQINFQCETHIRTDTVG